MKPTAKLLATIFTVLTMISASLLWLTREASLPSQSQFFDQPNAIWYIMMLVGIIMSFFTMNASFKGGTFGLVSFSAIAALAFDVLDFQLLHNISVTLVFITACICLMLYTPYRRLNLWLVGISSLAFLSGLAGILGPHGVFLGEVIAEILLSLGLLLIIWKKD